MSEGKRRRSAIERASIVASWRQSGLSVREFAEREGLSAQSLYLWRKQPMAAVEVESESERKPAFSELRLTAAQPQTSLVEVVARNGRVVRIHGDISVRALQQVLAAVEQC